MPTRCWVAPEMPHARYTDGFTVLPVWPTWCEYGTHPASTIARLAPAAPCSSVASSSIIAYADASPSPRPPETTTAASSRDGPDRSSAWLAVDRGRSRWRPRCPWLRVGSAAGGPPAGSATKDLARMTKIPGPSAVNLDLTVRVPPKTGCSAVSPPSSRQPGDVGEHRAVEAHREPPGDVAAVVARRDQDRVGRAGGPRPGPRSPRPRARRAARRRRRPRHGPPTRRTRRAARRTGAVPVPQLIASTRPARPRAAVSSSRLGVEMPPDVGSHRTQMVSDGHSCSLSDDFLGLEERDDACRAVALVDHDLALGSRLGRLDVRRSLGARPRRPPGRASPRSATLSVVDRLGLGRHDPLERRVPRLDDARGHGDDGRQRAGHLVVARLGLALDADRRAVDGDGLRERDRRAGRGARRAARASCRCSRPSTRWRRG